MIYAVITVRGVVQGVGFRPFINKLANRYNLKGVVYNRTGSVVIELSGDKRTINDFYQSIPEEKPEAALISDITIQYPKIKKSFKDFLIIKSKVSTEQKYVPPDLKICNSCKKELFDEKNRRYLYPFINCTNCGPRFSIILNTPYDRKNTTMAKFDMCGLCESEYKNINDRRYHAEPDACSKCGPQIFLKGKNSKIIKGNPALIQTRKLLKQGKIIAIKGIGGFHIACDATNNKAVLKLKKNKKRSDKPLAVMIDTIEKIKKIAFISAFEQNLIESVAAPVVLLKKKDTKYLSDEIAKGLNRIGVFLPYSPLHYLLFDKDIFALVMTSGNIAEEPIQHINEQCFKHLYGVVDYFLYHDRDINIPVDDSVVKPYLINKKNEDFIFIRRSRGYVPLKIEIENNNKNIIGAGALLKNTICLLDRSGAIMSQHIGDLENENVFRYYKQTLNDFIRFYDFKPQAIACDLHPDFLSSMYAEEFARKHKIKLIKVQHHYAHFLSVLAENKIFNEKVIGVIFDGTGLGPDGTIWGGEFFIGDFNGFKREAHFNYFRLPGGDLASRETIRPAVGLLLNFMDKKDIKKFFKKNEIDLYIEMIEKNINSPLTSSAGRIFDAVAAITGVCYKSTYEAQAPMMLEALAEQYKGRYKLYEYIIRYKDKILSVDVGPVLRQIIADLNKYDKKFISFSFHWTIANIILNMTQLLSKINNINKVVLAGGVFQNIVLLSMTLKILKKNGFDVLLHKQLSPNDSSIAFGQAMYAAKNI